MCLHRASGRAVVRIDGRDRYLGAWGSTQAAAAYRRAIAEWLAGHVIDDDRLAGGDPTRLTGELARRSGPSGTGTLAELAVAFLAHAQREYRRGDRVSSQITNYRAALRHALALYADCPIREFGPRKLAAVRAAMLRSGGPHGQGMTRSVANRYAKLITGAFRWAVGQEWVAPEIHAALSALRGLRRGTGGRESRPVRPLRWREVKPVRAVVLPEVWAMICLQWVTGMRPGEVCAMRGQDILRCGATWEYRVPADVDKTSHLEGEPRIVHLGRRAQTILAPWLEGLAAAGGVVFSPRRAVAGYRRRLVAERKARGGAGHHNKRDRPRRPRRAGVDIGYTVAGYRRAIARACESLCIDRWHPHQLRHSFATRVRTHYERAASAGTGDQMALTATAAALGHSDVETSKIYASLNRRLAAEVARKLG